ncbi:MAG: folate family ECF transporter S component [Dethiobacter sp.]|nr:folate family ECF transporter S component [Dethiobacter sp.]
MKLKTRQVIHAGLLVAISVVLTRFASFMLAGNTIRVTFGTIPIYIAGLLFGPAVGGLVGGVSDFLGVTINNFGSIPAPHLLLASVARGVIPPLVVRVLGNNDRNMHIKVVAAIVMTELVSGLWLTTWGLAWINNVPFMVLLPTRAIALVIQIPVYSMFTYAMIAKLRFYVTLHQVGR